LRDAGSTLTVSVSGAMDLLNTALRSTGHATITAGSLSVDAASNDGGAKGLRSGGALTVNVSGTVDNAGLIAGDVAHFLAKCIAIAAESLRISREHRAGIGQFERHMAYEKRASELPL